jgi:aryl-alcohol dehydrogenase
VPSPTLDVETVIVEEKGGPFRLKTVSVQAPRPDEVLVRVVTTGVCQTDEHSQDQELPVPFAVILRRQERGSWSLSAPRRGTSLPATMWR